ncbi:MAG: DegV family protein [Dehalococcoidales bacterium]|nr:DegV family protein [Dehalococcoidales bacterium]
MTIKVVTDSVSDISPAIADILGITVVPLNVVFSGYTYRDGVDMTTDEFYEKLEKEEIHPTTSTPAPQVFAEAYDRLADETDGILVITIGKKLSATGESAIKGVEAMKKKCRVEVVVSELAMMAEGLLAIAAAKAARDGAKLDELVKLTNHNIPRVGIRIAFDTLEYLHRGGRIGKAQALMGSMLGINPILGIKDGEVFPFGRERSRAKAIDHLYKFVAGCKKIEELAVEDATTPEETGAFVERLGAVYPREKIYLSKVSPVIGTNVGPSAIGVAVLGDL